VGFATHNPWVLNAQQVLLSRCGDALMLHLLLHASVFAPLPGGCLLQLSGLPAAEVRQPCNTLF
jgi:hypothetical protein